MSERLIKRGRVWHGWYYQDGERVQRTTRCTDRRAAEAVVREWEREASDPNHAGSTRALMRDALALVVRRAQEDAAAGKRSADTVSYYQRVTGTLSRLFEPDGEPFRLAKLRPADVDAYIAARRSEPARRAKATEERAPRVKDTTIGKELRALGRALKLAKRAGLWQGDVEELLPVDFGTGYTPVERWLPLDETMRLIAQLVPDRAARVAFIVATSARWGESNRARREDVTASIATSLIYLRGTKTEDSDRRVPVVLEEQVELLKFAARHAEGDRLLFTPWASVRRDLHAACRRAKIAPCSPNDLRRSYAHWMRQRGISPDLVGSAMGHADDRMVQRVYAPMQGEELLAAMRRAVAHLSQTPRTGALSSHPPHSETPTKQGVSVPRDGIEPPTRGFSSAVQRLILPRKDAVSTAERRARVAHLSQPSRSPRRVKDGRR